LALTVRHKKDMNATTGTDIQLRRPIRRGRTAVEMAKRRRLKGATEQRKITLPQHVWDLLAHVADLHTEAYALNNGSTQFTVSDLLESGAEMFLLSLREEFGNVPDKDSTKAERAAWVKRLADSISKQILEDFWSKKSH
jgi:hypothetical protein